MSPHLPKGNFVDAPEGRLRRLASAKGYGASPVSLVGCAAEYLWKSYVLVLLARLAPPGWTTWCHRLRGVRMGREVFIDRFAVIDGSFPERVTIEDEVRIAPGAAVLAHYEPGSTLARYTKPYVLDVRLGRYCFIGVNAVVMPGTTVGEGAIVTSGSVVLSDAPPYTVVSGNPAKPVSRLKPVSRDGRRSL
ncbi:MAG: acyltransferase [Vicinamibacterales bacterium]|nr:acyltransferase [Vicinamibacterales bacterium]MDP7477823.1 acyltransferase [Vicinamibacterales bacterium]HJN47039.1 acyltransferase [Vicinamibacterales bacterium]